MRLRHGLCAAALLAAACSPKQMALNRMASALASSTSVYDSDNDPEFVRVAAPSTLKTVEMLLSQSPRHPQLLLTACSGFTQYSYAFLHVESAVKAADTAAAQDLRARAARMYQRARGYCLSGIQIKHPGITPESLAADPVPALRATTADDVPWLYWIAMSWGADISLAPNPIARVTEVATVRTLLKRARELNDTWDGGAIYEAMIPFDGLPPLLGGSPAAARADFDKAQQLQHGTSVFAYVALALVTSNAAEKERLLDAALAVDVEKLTSRRLTSLIAQRYARALRTPAR
jgi:predicted anti-sigma-YlaC factor YlaD